MMNEKSSATATVEARMFVAGDSPTSLRALRNWQQLAARPELASVRLEVVNVMEEPQRALDDQVLATPTLVLVGSRTLRCIGTLDDGDRVVDLVERCRQP